MAESKISPAEAATVERHLKLALWIVDKCEGVGNPDMLGALCMGIAVTALQADDPDGVVHHAKIMLDSALGIMRELTDDNSGSTVQ